MQKAASAFQVDASSNPMDGLEGRTSLLINLADALKASTDYFGPDARPGNLIGSHPLIPSSCLFS